MRRALTDELVARALAPDTGTARGLIDAGRVLVSGTVAHNPGRLVARAEPVLVTGADLGANEEHPFVGRGGVKLSGALGTFCIDVTGVTALDAGASTGGFTDCLLVRGAARVIAVDVGYGLIHERLRADERVQLLERTNVRVLSPDDIGGIVPDFVTADLSFISLTAVAGALIGIVGDSGKFVLLVKPQFEVPKSAADRGRGVIRDPVLWRSALDAVVGSWLSHGAGMMGAMVSPINGAGGNVEFFLHAQRGAATLPAGWDDLLDNIVYEAALRIGVA